MPHNGSSSAIGIFLAGAAVGAILALLFAPQSGEETREWLQKKARQDLKKLKTKGQRLRKRAHDLYDEGREQLADVLEVGSKAARKVEVKTS